MQAAVAPDVLPTPATAQHGRRLRVTLVASTAWGLVLSLPWQDSTGELLLRTTLVGLLALLAFQWLERWPRRLPRWVARWTLQVIGVAAAVPLATLAAYVIHTAPDQPPFWLVSDRLGGFALLSVTGMLLAPWVAMSALLRQRDELVRDQARVFERERGELQRQALDARLQLLQAQVSPHFLFNTLANVRELVDMRSPQASQVLDHLVAYLRAAIPRLDESTTTLGRELELVRAYLELMKMRMPDRMQFRIEVEQDALALRCPPITVLTLVENAVRHGIDPSEDGGRIEVSGRIRESRCRIEVRDSGVGLGGVGRSTGTGLDNLRERLRLAFDGDAWLHVTNVEPSGVRVELEFPAARAGA